MAKAKKALAKSSFVEKNLETSLERLAVAAAAVEQSVTVRAVDAKKLTASVKRIAKRKAILTKRKRIASDRAKKSPGADTRQALRTVIKDLTNTTKELTKLRGSKAENAGELVLLKAAQLRTKGYSKGIADVDRALAKKK